MARRRLYLVHTTIFIVKNFLKILGISAALIGASHASAALVIGLNPSSPLGGYDLGGGQFASLLGIQSPESLVGQTIALSNLNAAIQSGVVSGFYFAAGSTASANFGPVIPFTPFVSAFVQAAPSGLNPTKVWDSLYAVHSDTVVFSNGSGGTTTLSTGGTRIVDDPFTTTSLPPTDLTTPSSVPDSGATIGLFGAVLAGIALLRRRFIG
jgi:hypothetical protein